MPGLCCLSSNTESNIDPRQAFFPAFAALTFAHLAFCAALIAAMPAALIFRLAGFGVLTDLTLVPFVFAHLAF